MARSPEIRVSLCGRFSVARDGEFVHERLPGQQGRLLVSALALDPGSAVERERLTEILWPAGPPPAAAPAMRALISKTRALDHLVVRALEVIAGAGLALGEHHLPEAEGAALALVETHPFREPAHELLMRILARRGARAEALLVYEDLRRRLRTHLGAAPTPALRALHQHLIEEST